jgi:DNA repair exonuclease SbcCD ATPase subunit
LEQEEFDAALADLEVRLERLRSLYEQYFLGIERIEPNVARKDVDRRFWQIRKVKVRNTAKRFKLQNLVQRYNTLQQHWGKICRQIEAGTYIRHVARAKRRANDLQEEKRTARQARRASLAPLGAAVPGDSPSGSEPRVRDGAFDAKIERLHNDLAAAEAKLRPGGKTVSKKALAESLRMTEAKLRHKHAGMNVDFQVVIRDGRAAIKPIVSKSRNPAG